MEWRYEGQNRPCMKISLFSTDEDIEDWNYISFSSLLGTRMYVTKYIFAGFRFIFVFDLQCNGRYNPDNILRWSLLSPFPKNILNWFASGQESLYRGWARTMSHCLSLRYVCLDESDPEEAETLCIYLIACKCSPKLDKSQCHFRVLSW